MYSNVIYPTRGIGAGGGMATFEVHLYCLGFFVVHVHMVLLVHL